MMSGTGLGTLRIGLGAGVETHPQVEFQGLALFLLQRQA